MTKPKPVASFRLDETLVKKAKAKGLDLPALFEATLAKFLKDKRCPYCGK
jgi:post-segregation antitoxin (ccd killing protein)